MVWTMSGCGRNLQTVRLSSGRDQSAYSRIGKQIQEIAPQVGLQVEDNFDSQGSQQNLERLLSRDVDFALVQLDVASEAMKKGEVVAVAMLTEEYLHIVSQDAVSIQDFAELQGKTVDIGAPGSGINFTASRLFRATNLTIQPKTGDSLERFTDKTLDAIVYVGPLKASVQVREKLRQSAGLKFVPLSLSFINYLTLQFPESYRKAYIPQGTYKPLPALPSVDILTISTGGALLTRPDVPRETVALMAWTIFSNARQFASFYSKLAMENGAMNLYEGLLYVHPGAIQAYQSGDPRVAWLKYLRENTPLQAASIMLLTTTSIGFLLRGWRKRKTGKIIKGHRQVIAELQAQLTTDPRYALQETENLQQQYRLMLIEGNLSPDLYQRIDNMNEILVQQCRNEINRQQDGNLNQIIADLTDLHDHNDQDWIIKHLQTCQKTYREMLINGHLDFQTYLSLYQMQLLLSTVLVNSVSLD
ncbi:MAG: hypothetical protein RLZZ568_55 [Cyanobacteriota bacterium]